MVEEQECCEDELWMRAKQLDLFVLTRADHRQISAPPTGDPRA